ncbi:Mu-like prophage protein gp36 [Devosia enhydra]|uniref:Mu-like prophage protein gp36 n=1 Tax=Devosia enhydra TaxID=665118 RepID=A0A1K2I165_9HYPH|nr:DUF1320 domain-containing protein [Devosia enhydra]SFZ85999.1 Mu-like prophage protein gp36 [Devosia enhydra]
MAYCTLQQLIDRYGQGMLIQLSDRGDTAPEEPDSDLFARAIADAAALIDGYLFGRYQLPLAEVPALLADVALRVTIYFAHGSVAPEKIRKDYDDALKLLREISSGTVKLNVAGIEPASSPGEGLLVNEPHRPMTSDTMKGYI